jgi:Xaa-Pro aminopeptidase
MTSILQKISAAAILLAATAVVPACTNDANKAELDKMSKDVSDAKMAAESAARSAAQAADAAKAAQQAADQASMTQSHATGHGMRNK